MPLPKPPGRDVRAVATLVDGWIKEAATEEAFWLEFPGGEFSGIAKNGTLDVHVRHSMGLTLIKGS